MDNRRMSPRRRERVLDAIEDGLEEISAHFEIEGFSTGEVALSQQEGSPDYESDADEDFDVDEGFSRKEAFDREDIEIALDSFLSHLIQEGLIKKNKAASPPEFSEVFEKVFGTEHPITKKAQTFEKHIKGYFGFVGYEDMKAAFSELIEIQAMIEAEVKRSADASTQRSFEIDPPRETQ